MGGLVEKQCRNALKALTKGDLTLAEKVATSDYKVNDLEVSINAKCTDLLALRQPAASDLRMIVGVIRMAADLERIGDEAEKIGRLAETIASGRDSVQFREDPKHLGKSAIDLLQGALDAFARLDVEAAIVAAAKDPDIDREFDSITRLSITHMMEQPASVKTLLRINWCARAFERIGDHAVNLCEEVVFLVKGSDVRHLSIKEIQDRYL
ncbi:phosphate signaling complex protein PhoU [Halioglobus maricola]|uniref:Phosphate-specific transport system accessory protein PhoU n=2 Tax=Halioglobus maricola TaxID=2601894 RepID=A0A5P9NQC1_9GAMM|nr:phosphate signaling complex protein PhoU [Halioglobus maricola]